MQRQKVVALVVGVAMASASGAWFAASRITSPDAARRSAQPPRPSLVTAAVERRTLSSTVELRGTIGFDDTQAITLHERETGATTGSEVLTGLPQQVGDEIAEGDVAAEVAGRPIFVFVGESPALRDLRRGSAGPDVRQLEEALARLGHGPGTVDEAYDESTEAAVGDLYASAHYSRPAPTREQADRARDARLAVVAAERSARSADAQSASAARPDPTVVLAARGAVAAAQRELDAARLGAAAARSTAADSLTVLRADNLVADAEQAVAEAFARLMDALQPAATAERNVSDAAALALADARDQLAAAEAELGGMPRSEFVFLGALPRRVASIASQVGDVVRGDVLTVSGPTASVRSSVAAADRSLIEVGAAATITANELDLAIPATVVDVAERPTALASVAVDGDGGDASAPDDRDGANRFAVRLELDSLPAETDLTALEGVSFQVSIPVESTAGEVLVVPLASLTTGGDRQVRVEVVETGGRTRLVQVTPGLSADGLVEVRTAAGLLDDGDRVVVGR